MDDNDLITRREVELVLLEKGQKSKRYKLGEIWELNFSEIREALSEYQSDIVHCKDCNKRRQSVYRADGAEYIVCWNQELGIQHPIGWFCADGKRREDDA